MKTLDTIQGYSVALAKEMGLVPSVLFNQLSFWSNKGSRADGWVYKTYRELEDELGISERQIRTAYEKLENAGYIETTIVKANGAPTKHFRILRNVRMDSDKTSETMDSDKTSDSITETTINNLQTPTNSSFGEEKKYTGVVICTFHEDTGKPGANCRECHTNQRATNERELIATVNRVTGRNFRTLGSRGVKKTLNAFTLEEIEGALRALVADEWHKNKLKDLSIEYFTRATTIDRFVERGRQMQPQQLANRDEQRRLDRIEELEEEDAFRNDRREEYWEAKKSPTTLDTYRKKYGVNYHANL